MTKLAIVVIDCFTSLPAFLFAAWMALTDPFPGEKVFWSVIAVCALFVMLPGIVVLSGGMIPRVAAVLFTTLYVLMLLAGLYILLYDSTYGPWWELAIICICLASVGKSMYGVRRASR